MPKDLFRTALKSILGALVGIFWTLPALARAQDLPAAGESAATLQHSKARSNFSSSYIGTTTAFISGDTPIANEPPTSTNIFLLNYKFYKSYLFGIVAGFELRPFLWEKSQFYNPAIRFGDQELIKTESFRLSDDLRLILPMTSESKIQTLQFALQTTPIITYRPLSSSFWIYSFNRFRYHFFDQVGLGRKMILFSRTHFNYDLTEHLAISWVTVFQVFQRNKAAADLEVDRFRSGPGFSWSPIKSLTISPHITWNVLTPRLNDLALFVVASGQLF